jgi:DNA-binding LytR/AlgR family response regulator
MSVFNCLIVDDEPIARQIVQTYCSHLPYLNVVGTSGNALEAKKMLQEKKIDILFLDINMPVIDGISFLKTLKNTPQVIFTTAYREYAVDAYELAACDYLLKPFSLERFIIAVDRATEKLQAGADVSEQPTEEYFFLKTDGKIFKLLYDDILYAEANGNYSKIITRSQVLLPGMTFSNVEELLPTSIFFRVHRSFIINKSKISHIEGNRVFIGQREIPIGSNHKEAFFKALGL